jgi:predicted O-methyltransferase YrrM
MDRTLAIGQRARGRVRREVGAALRPTARALGFDLEERHFYSPIPRLSEVAESFWHEPASMCGVRLNVDRGIELLAGPLQGHISSFTSAGAFHLKNGTYEGGDAEVLYAMIKHAQPRRIVELGSGASSALIASAVEGLDVDYRIFDPYPNRYWESAVKESGFTIRAVSATQVPMAEFIALGAGDVLFVDTTHTVRIGGDVTQIVLEVLPALASGVLVHFHDIFLPYHYPKQWVEQGRRYWAEQYLLQAFLAFNSHFEVVLPLHAISREHPGRLGQIVPSFGPDVHPGAFWIKRC